MRRRILAPLKQGLAEMGAPNSRQTRILDVACGTGRTLKMIRGALSEVSLYGADLSEAYLRKANQLLSEDPGELPQLLQANAEAGVFEICDSHDLSVAPDLAPLMEGFTAMFHEPYYGNYIRDDLEARLQQAGFVEITTESHFMSKCWFARKPE